MNYPTEVIETDVLIIGGGLAGARAAIEASDHNSRVMMVMKAKFGQGGLSAPPTFDGMAVPLGDTDPQDNAEEFFKNIIQIALGMCDEKLAHILAYESVDRFKDLVNWGMVPQGMVNGRYQQFKGDSHDRPRGMSISQSTPPGFTVLRQQVEKRDIKVIDDVMILSLLTRHGICVGALGIDKRGHFQVFKAKSTVLAVGGAHGVFPPSSDATVAGDGYAMAFHAGAELYNLEFLQIICDWGNLNPQLILLKPDIYNRFGDRFLPRYLPKGVTIDECFTQRLTTAPFTTRNIGKYWDIAVYKEIVEGRGPVFLDFTMLPQNKVIEFMEEIKRNSTWYSRVFPVSSEILKKPIECAPIAHAFNGGLRINEKTESTLPGLYAAGEVAAGPHGADRMGGCMVSATQVFGARAGRFAAERAKTIDEVTIDQKQVDYICHGASKIMANKGVIKVSEIENKIRNLMWRNCLTVRSQKGLEDCIKELKRIKYEELPKLSITDNIETLRALAIPNMLDAAQMIANAALQRKESRGTHFREDFSSKDDINWLKPVNINKRDTDLG